MERDQSYPGCLFWLDPCYTKMDQHVLPQTKNLPMPGWGGQPLWQDCLLSHAALHGNRQGLWTEEGAGSQLPFPSSWMIHRLGRGVQSLRTTLVVVSLQTGSSYIVHSH